MRHKFGFIKKLIFCLPKLFLPRSLRSSITHGDPKITNIIFCFDGSGANYKHSRPSTPLSARLHSVSSEKVLTTQPHSALSPVVTDDKIINGWPWPENKSIIDGFPSGMSAHEVTGLLSSVGFSSPPSWLKPFRVLSNGEQCPNLLCTLATPYPSRSVPLTA